MKRKIIFLILVILSLFMCFPVIFLIAGSFMGKAELTGHLAPVLGKGKDFVSWGLLPKYPTIRSYVELLLDTPQFFVMFWNSVKIVFLSIAGQLIVGIAAAWGFARYNFRFKKILFTLYIVVMLMPFQVTMLSSYLVLDSFKLLDTHWSIILPAIFSTFSVFIMYRFFCNIPEAIIESARIDGASELKIFFKIGIPLGMPGIMSAVILQFLELWNLIEQPLTFLKDKSLWPLSIYLPNITLENADIAFTASAVTLIAAIIVFFAGQSYLEQGIAASAVKE
ncbi:carbohydrate ABC transporter permease [Clostridium sp. NSJ-49]|uniref:Sugar permease n=1 Tax=Clostridium disporicum TaxID=84024 RepID=A0A174HCC4_9CLOT|nr:MULTISPECIES: carbohydrate ABC transporter permease [Clostridium]MBC5625296.1 carbohydrate ABC transporter permease [Clostridium sp. NSJ-49]MCD2502142.1 carbohydrate ABC transporter permease [Clostridium sp. NSJ-145]CUO72484.1 sugar permease [Clostridium disporicum]